MEIARESTIKIEILIVFIAVSRSLRKYNLVVFGSSAIIYFALPKSIIVEKKVVTEVI